MKALCFLLLLATSGAYGVAVQTTSRNCGPGLAEASQTISEVPFPEDWRVVLACDAPTWDYLRRKADALETRTAFTNLRGRITVVNWELFARPNVVRPAKRVLWHELGHIRCGCRDENRVAEYELSRRWKGTP